MVANKVHLIRNSWNVIVRTEDKEDLEQDNENLKEEAKDTRTRTWSATFEESLDFNLKVMSLEISSETETLVRGQVSSVGNNTYPGEIARRQESHCWGVRREREC